MIKAKSFVSKKYELGLALVVMAAFLSLTPARAEQPLSKDDITLLLLASSPSAKIIQMVEQRGVDFQMNPDLAKKLHDNGASDDLIEALQKAGNKAKTAVVGTQAPPPSAESKIAAPAAPESSPEGKPNAPGAPEPPAATAPAPSAASSSSEPVLHSRTPATASSSEPVLHTRDSTAPAAPPAANASPAASAPPPASSSEPTLRTSAKAAAPVAPATTTTPTLKDPDPQEVQHIIQEFAAKEKIFRVARNNYTYHQINKVEELGPDNQITGTFEQEWDILYDDSGKRIEKVTYAPQNTLKGLIVTKEDIEGFRNIQPFVLTTDELPEYDISYMGHVKVDEITAYVFRIRPKEMQKGKQYFQGVVYVDDRDLQIVKSDGRQVPQEKKEHGQENLFPRFTTYREQVDGKFWFPTYTMADDTLYFSQGPPIHMKEIVRYTDYKQFKSGVRILGVESIDKPNDQSKPATASPQK